MSFNTLGRDQSYQVMALLGMIFNWVLTLFYMRYAQSLTSTGIDNDNPQGQLARLAGWGARAVAAHRNTLEAFVFFAPAVVLNVFISPRDQASPSTGTILASLIVLGRFIYPFLYIYGYSTARSTLFSVVFCLNMAYYWQVFKWTNQS